MDLAYSFSFWAKYACVDSAIWQTVLGLDLFDLIPGEGEGSISLDALAEQAGVSWRGTRVIIEPLVSQRVLRNNEGDLSIEQAFVPVLRDVDFLAQLKDARRWWYPSQQLVTAVKTGAPIAYQDQIWDVLAHISTTFMSDPVPGHLPEEAAWVFDGVARNFWRTQALVCASELGLLNHLSKQPASSPQCAETCQSSGNGMAVLLDTLTQCGVLEKEGEAYRYHPEAARLLSPKIIASYKLSLGLTNMYWQTLGELEAAVHHAHRSLDLHIPELSGQFYLALARYNTSVFSSYFQIIRNVPKTLNQNDELVHANVLDVGAGSGVWGAAFAHAEDTSHVTFMDQPQVLAQTKRNIERLKLKNETEVWGADLLQVDYGEDRFDVIILGQICHTQHPDDLPGLFQKLARALRPEGYLVIADQVLNEQRDAPLDYLYFGVKEFLSTQGDILSLPEYVALLEDAGFDSYQCYRLLGIDVIVGRTNGRSVPDSLVSSAKQTVAA